MLKTKTQMPDVRIFLKRFIDNESDWDKTLSYLGLNSEDIKKYNSEGKNNGKSFFPKWGVDSDAKYIQNTTVYEERMDGQYEKSPLHEAGQPLFKAKDFQPTYELGMLEVVKGVQTVSTNINRLGNPGNASVKLVLPLLENGTEDKTLLMVSVKDVLNKDYSALTHENIEQLKRNGVPDSFSSAELSTRRLNILQTNIGKPSMFASNMKTIFRPMDKIQIWFRKKSATGYLFPSDYAVAFTGLLSEASVSYSGGKIEVNLMAEDVLKWLRITRVNVTPSVTPQFSEGNIRPTAFSTIFAGQKGIEIVKSLLLGSADPNSQSWLQRINPAPNPKYGGIDTILYAVRNKKTGDVDWRPVQFLDEQKKRPMLSWVDPAVEELYPSRDVMGVGEFQLTGKLSYARYESVDGVQTKISKSQYDALKAKAKISGNIIAYEREVPQAGMLFKLQTDFTTSNVLIPEKWINDWAPYRHLFQSTFQLWQSDYKYRLDLIKEVAEISDFEFFADASGTVHYRPPLYMLTPGVSYSWIFNYGETNPQKLSPYVFEPQYFIEDLDVISENFTISDRDIKTYVTVTGQYNYLEMEDIAKVNTTLYYDPVLVNRYGIRMSAKQLPILAGKDSDADNARTAYTQAWLNRQNSGINTGALTLVGTPELEVGRTIGMVGDMDSVLNSIKKVDTSAIKSAQKGTIDVELKIQSSVTEEIKRMPVYYITSLTNNYTQGKQFTTTLGLTHGRILGNRFGTGFLGFGIGDDAQTMNDMFNAIDYEPAKTIQKNLPKEREEKTFSSPEQKANIIKMTNSALVETRPVVAQGKWWQISAYHGYNYEIKKPGGSWQLVKDDEYIAIIKYNEKLKLRQIANKKTPVAGS